MKVIELEIEGRRFHIYFFSSIQKDLNTVELITPIYPLTIAQLFRMVKTSLDMKCEVLILEDFNYEKAYAQLHKHHLKLSPDKFLYLNISIKNKMISFYNEHSLVNNFKSLEENTFLINFFSQ